MTKLSAEILLEPHGVRIYIPLLCNGRLYPYAMFDKYLDEALPQPVIGREISPRVLDSADRAFGAVVQTGVVAFVESGMPASFFFRQLDTLGHTSYRAYKLRHPDERGLIEDCDKPN